MFKLWRSYCHKSNRFCRILLEISNQAGKYFLVLDTLYIESLVLKRRPYAMITDKYTRELGRPYMAQMAVDSIWARGAGAVWVATGVGAVVGITAPQEV
jgi:hypothetical protein